MAKYENGGWGAPYVFKSDNGPKKNKKQLKIPKQYNLSGIEANSQVYSYKWTTKNNDKMQN